MCVTLLEQAQVEGGKEMSDVLLGMIIGGIIGVAGSAVAALIKGHYSLKGRRQDNLASQQQQITQIRHEKNRELIRRIVEVRVRYLEPICEHLTKLQATTRDFQSKILDVFVSYRREEREIGEESERGKTHEVEVKAAKKQESIQELRLIDNIVSEMESVQSRIEEASIDATDVNLRDILAELVLEIYSLRQAYYSMRLDLTKSTAEDDFIYDFKQITSPMGKVRLSIGRANARIEALLGGADAGDE